MWTSSLRLRGGALGTGACLAALACAANGWAAGGTPMPAPDDPPPAYQTSTVKTSAPTTAPTAPKVKRVVEFAPAVPTPDAPVSAASTTTAKAAHREAGRGSRARSLSGRGVRIVHSECLDIAACECGGHRARHDSRPSLDVHSAAFGAEAESEAEAEGAAEDRGHQGEADGAPSRRPAPGRHPARSAGRSARPPRTRR